MTEFKKGDHVKITCDGKTVPGRISMMSPNQRAGMLWWDIMLHECMLAGHLGVMPIMINENGIGYHSLMGGEPVALAPSEPVEDTFEQAMREIGL